jgi:enoyl-CoA hydratase/carnithine racemase
VASRCLPAADVLAEALSFARDMAVEAAPLSLAMCKQILWTAADGSLEDVDRLESEAHQLLMGAPDALEGGSAAFEKRPPRWSGRVARDWPSEGSFSALPPVD